MILRKGLWVRNEAEGVLSTLKRSAPPAFADRSWDVFVRFQDDEPSEGTSGHPNHHWKSCAVVEKAGDRRGYSTHRHSHTAQKRCSTSSISGKRSQRQSRGIWTVKPVGCQKQEH